MHCTQLEVCQYDSVLHSITTININIMSFWQGNCCMTYENYQTVLRKRTEFDEVFNGRCRLDRTVEDKGKNTNKDGHFHWLNDPNALHR